MLYSRTLLSALLLTSLVQGCCPEGEGGGNPFQVGESALIEVTPDPISFTTVNVGESDTITVTIRNAVTASGPLDITKVYLNQATDLEVTQPEKLVLEAGESTTVDVIYTPSDALLDSGQLVIEYHNMTEPKIVQINTVEQVGTLTIIPNPISFGQVQGGTAKLVQAQIVNNGSDAVELGNAVLSLDTSADILLMGVYELTGEACGGLEGLDPSQMVTWPRTLQIGDSICVELKYQPFGGGTDNGVLQLLQPIVPGAPKPPPEAQATIKGVEVGPELTFIPEAKLDFAAVDIGDSKTLSFSIINEGSEDLVIQSVTKGEQLGDAWVDIKIDTEVAVGTSIDPDGKDGIAVEVTFTRRRHTR